MFDCRPSLNAFCFSSSWTCGRKANAVTGKRFSTRLQIEKAASPHHRRDNYLSGACKIRHSKERTFFFVFFYESSVVYTKLIAGHACNYRCQLAPNSRNCYISKFHVLNYIAVLTRSSARTAFTFAFSAWISTITLLYLTSKSIQLIEGTWVRFHFRAVKFSRRQGVQRIRNYGSW